MIGSAGVIVMDDTVSIPEALHGAGAVLRPRVVRAVHAVPRVAPAGSTRWCTGSSSGDGRKEDLDTILDVAKRGAGTTICAFYDGAVGPYIATSRSSASEFEA